MRQSSPQRCKKLNCRGKHQNSHARPQCPRRSQRPFPALPRPCSARRQRRRRRRRRATTATPSRVLRRGPTPARLVPQCRSAPPQNPPANAGGRKTPSARGALLRGRAPAAPGRAGPGPRAECRVGSGAPRKYRGDGDGRSDGAAPRSLQRPPDVSAPGGRSRRLPRESLRLRRQSWEGRPSSRPSHGRPSHGRPSPACRPSVNPSPGRARARVGSGGRGAGKTARRAARGFGAPRSFGVRPALGGPSEVREQ